MYLQKQICQKKQELTLGLSSGFFRNMLLTRLRLQKELGTFHEIHIRKQNLLPQLCVLVQKIGILITIAYHHIF